VPDFKLAHVTADATLELTGPAIVLCTAGSASVAGKNESVSVSRGQAVFVSPDEDALRFTLHDDGVLFVATDNR
jgi:mannose-6-phosphate isomerase